MRVMVALKGGKFEVATIPRQKHSNYKSSVCVFIHSQYIKKQGIKTRENFLSLFLALQRSPR
jgi:hypothetical protein